MSQRLSRKDIKRDEFRDRVAQAVSYAGSHVRSLMLAGLAVILVVAAAVGVYLWFQSRDARANRALARAMTVYQAPVDKDDPAPDDEIDPSFASEQARSDRAKELFGALRDRFASTGAGRTAWLYLGKIAADQGDADTAREDWQHFIDQGGSTVLVTEAYLNWIALDREQGRGEEVAERLASMVDAPESQLPKDVLLFELATTYEQLGREEEALDTYQRLVEEFATSGYTQEARQRLVALGGSPTGLGGLPIGAG